MPNGDGTGPDGMGPRNGGQCINRRLNANNRRGARAAGRQGNSYGTGRDVTQNNNPARGFGGRGANTGNSNVQNGDCRRRRLRDGSCRKQNS